MGVSSEASYFFVHSIPSSPSIRGMIESSLMLLLIKESPSFYWCFLTDQKYCSYLKLLNFEILKIQVIIESIFSYNFYPIILKLNIVTLFLGLIRKTFSEFWMRSLFGNSIRILKILMLCWNIEAPKSNSSFNGP